MYNYSEKHNVLFVHIPKNAGTSILDSLEIKNAKHYPLSVLQGYMDKETFDNAIKIAVVRNPWERMVSYYRYRQLKNQDPKDFPFSYWLRNGAIQYNMGNFDMMPQCKWLNNVDSLDMPECIDYIFNYDLLDSQWKEFCEIEKINAKPLKTLNTTGTYQLERYYKMIDDVILVGHYFRTDVANFDFEFGVKSDFPLLKGPTEISEKINKQ
jgi:hypothetical protein